MGDSLAGKIAVVTGAARGCGRVIAVDRLRRRAHHPHILVADAAGRDHRGDRGAD